MPTDAHTGIWVPPAGRPHRSPRNPMLGEFAPDGQRYTVCPACSAYAMTQRVDAENPDPAKRHVRYECHRCGYVDCEGCLFGDHEKN